MLVWTDLETTGIEPKEDIILEVAMVVTDDDLNELDYYRSLVIEENPTKFIPRVPTLTQAPGKRLVYDVHFDNGLVTELCNAAVHADPTPNLRYVQTSMVRFLNDLGVHEGLEMDKRPPLAGATISFDRSFLAEYMPKVLKLLHYRNVDVTTIRELAHRWWPDLPDAERKGAHRALDDIRESIDLLRYYRDKEFICGP